MAKPAVIYVRESTKKQELSPEVQIARGQHYARACGFAEIVVIHDPATSTKQPLAERPGGRRLLATVRRGEVAAVVGYKLDRMFRNVIDCLTNVDEWRLRGVALHLMDLGGTPVDTASAAGRFMLTVLAAAAEMERNFTRERTRDAIRHRRRQKRPYGFVPFGYRRACDHAAHPKDAPRTPECMRLVPVPGQQDTLRLMRALRSQGHSYDRIAECLRRGRHRTARGGRWFGGTVRDILVNEIHAA